MPGPAARAPIDPALLAGALEPLGRATMLPAVAYTSRNVLAWERRHVFAGSWLCLGRVDELAGGGAVHTRALTAGDVGVVVTVDDTDAPGAFANVCRHRGHELLPAGGSTGRDRLACPYHGWIYGLDGRLRSSAGMGIDGLDLIALPTAVWQGWLFVDALGSAPPFDEFLGDLAELVEPYQPGDLRLAARHTYTVAANWKVVVENYHECYHCPQIHPELCRVTPPASGENWDRPGAWIGGSMELRPGAETMSFDGRSHGRPIPGVDPATVLYLGLFPNLLVSAHPDYVMAHRLHPEAPDRTEIECSWYVPEGVEDASYAVDFWDLTNRQDWSACESVQRGLANPHFRPGPLGPREDAVHHWVSLMANIYLDPAAALAAAASRR
jgi:Rieske 2Fe-2S family protein